MSDKEISITKKRVHECTASKGLRMDKLAKIAGITYPTLWKSLNGQRKFKPEELVVIAGVLDTSIDYLLGAIDNPHKFAPLIKYIDEETDKKLAERYAKESNDPATVKANDDKAIDAFVTDLMRKNEGPVVVPLLHEPPASAPVLDQNTGPILPHKWLPILDQEACAGNGFDYDSVAAEAKEWLPWPTDRTGGPSEPHLPFFIPVHGDSMSGVGIDDGTMVLVNPNVEVLNGNPAFVEWCGMRSIKGFIQYPDGRVELRPANPNYQIVYIDAEDAQSDKFRVIGKVVRRVDIDVPGNVM